MTVNRKPTGRASSVPAGLAVGTVCALGITFLGAMLIAKLVDSEVIEQGAIGYGAMITLLAASFAGAKMAYGRIKRLRMQMGLLNGLVYFLCLLAMTALLFGGQYTAVGVTALLILCGSILASMPVPAGRGGKARRKYKIPG